MKTRVVARSPLFRVLRTPKRLSQLENNNHSPPHSLYQNPLNFLKMLRKIRQIIPTRMSGTECCYRIRRQCSVCNTLCETRIIHNSQKWKKSKSPSTEEICKMWCIHTIKYYPAIKWNEVLVHATKLMSLENIMLS